MVPTLERRTGSSRYLQPPTTPTLPCEVEGDITNGRHMEEVSVRIDSYHQTRSLCYAILFEDDQEYSQARCLGAGETTLASVRQEDIDRMLVEIVMAKFRQRMTPRMAGEFNDGLRQDILKKLRRQNGTAVDLR